MPYDIAAQAAETGGNIVNAGLGIALAGINDRRQIKQQQKLQDMQIRGNMQMGDYNYQKQLDMWKATSYGGQTEEMKKAGLNPGLLYGMGGSGGQSTGSPGGTVQGGHAPTGGGEAMAMTMAGLQARLLQAQEENIKADTANKKATEPNIGLEGGLIRTNIMKGIADVDKVRAETALKGIEAQLAQIDLQIKGRTTEDVITTIQHGALKMIDDARIALAKANVAPETEQAILNNLLADLATKAMLPELLKAQTVTEQGKPAVQQADIKYMQDTITNQVQSRMQKWREIEEAGMNRNSAERMEFYRQLAAETKMPIDILEKIGQAIILKNAMQRK